MGDISQSRYSIVERLTTQKLQVMDEKQGIEGDIEAKKVYITQVKKNIEVKKKRAQEQLETDVKMMQDDIADIEREIASLEKGKTSKVKLCEEKIKELDSALKAIADISAASAEEAKVK